MLIWKTFLVKIISTLKRITVYIWYFEYKIDYVNIGKFLAHILEVSSELLRQTEVEQSGWMEKVWKSLYLWY